jgi:hypothetical protein
MAAPNTKHAIDLAIDKTHLKANKQIVPHVQNAIPTATRKQIEDENATRPKDNNPHKRSNYYVPIFSPHPYAYQIDLLQQSNDRNPTTMPAYYLIAININTRFAYAYPQPSKTQTDILANIQRLKADAKKITSIVSDEENGILSQTVLDYLTTQKISLKVITEQRHTPLAIIDRFIRQLRDMNTPTVHTQRTSDNPKYRDFTPHRMQKLITIHNNTIQQNTNHTPTEMQNGLSLEKSYIIRKLYDRERRTKITDADLPDNTHVRHILQKEPLKKHRYKISPEYYNITGKDGHSYIISARDGTTKTVSRWRLFPVSDISKLKFGASFRNNRGEVETIHAYNPTDKTYDVSFKMPDGSHYNDTISLVQIRGSNPQIKTPLEIEYFRTHTQRRH